MLQGISIHAFLAANLLWKQRKEAVQSAFLRALHFIQTLTKGHQSTLIWRWICPLLRPRLSFKHWPSACGVDFKKVLNFNIKNHSIPRHDCGIDNHYQTGRICCFFLPYITDLAFKIRSSTTPHNEMLWKRMKNTGRQQWLIGNVPIMLVYTSKATKHLKQSLLLYWLGGNTFRFDHFHLENRDGCLMFLLLSEKSTERWKPAMC